jgi:hypothetical protein
LRNAEAPKPDKDFTESAAFSGTMPFNFVVAFIIDERSFFGFGGYKNLKQKNYIAN